MVMNGPGVNFTDGQASTMLKKLRLSLPAKGLSKQMVFNSQFTWTFLLTKGSKINVAPGPIFETNH